MADNKNAGPVGTGHGTGGHLAAYGSCCQFHPTIDPEFLQSPDEGYWFQVAQPRQDEYAGDVSAALADTLELEERHQALADYHAGVARWHALRVLQLRANRRHLETYLPGDAL